MSISTSIKKMAGHLDLNVQFTDQSSQDIFNPHEKFYSAECP